MRWLPFGSEEASPSEEYCFNRLSEMPAIPLGLPHIIHLCIYDDGDCGETCPNHYDVSFICGVSCCNFTVELFFILLHFHILKTLDKELSFLHGELMIPLQQGSDRDWRT